MQAKCTHVQQLWLLSIYSLRRARILHRSQKSRHLLFSYNQLFTLRGNGWYSLPMAMYCLEQKIITEADIRQVIYSSLTIPKTYYNKFIEYLDGVIGDKSKLAVNSMIGCFKPKMRENWRSLLITTNPNIALAHFLNKTAALLSRAILEITPTIKYITASTQTAKRQKRPYITRS